MILFFSFQLVGLLYLLLATSVFPLPTLLPSEITSIASTEQAEPEYSHLSTELPSEGHEPGTTEDAHKPVPSDEDDMETAEVLVFRPLFSYKRVEAERRRKLKQARRQSAYYPYYPYYPY
jgi:hypothetical protein